MSGQVKDGIPLDFLTETTPNSCVHSLPCHVKTEAGKQDVNVTSYFEPMVANTPQTMANGEKVLSASLRGRPLLGIQLQLPQEYKGIVISDRSNQKMSIESQFSYLHHWCLDTQPSADDDNIRTLQWLTVANSLHQPILMFSKDEQKHTNDLETPSQ